MLSQLPTSDIRECILLFFHSTLRLSHCPTYLINNVFYFTTRVLIICIKLSVIHTKYISRLLFMPYSLLTLHQTILALYFPLIKICLYYILDAKLSYLSEIERHNTLTHNSMTIVIIMVNLIF